MAASGPWTETAAVAQWLYRYGTVPRIPAFDRDFGPEDDPMAVLGLTVGGSTRRLLEASYEATSLQGWYSFAHLPVQAQVAAVCKLYVSPRPEALPEAFPRICDAFVRHGVRSFKVGRGIEGLLRPDKIIAYFENRPHMEDVAGALQRSLRGCPPHGVPFTADVCGNGMLSSGVDPPAGDAAASWRSWITKRLAASLISHRDMPAEDRVSVALAEIDTVGVDSDLWAPDSDCFRRVGLQ